MHWQWIVAQNYGLVPRYFGTHALSFEIGAIKPDRDIYLAAAEMANVAPEQVFYLDDIAGHVDGALQAGFDAVQFLSASELVEELNQRGLRIAI